MADDYLVGEMYLAPDLAEAAETVPVVGQQRATHDFARKGIAALSTALRTQDPTRTPDAHMLEVRKKGEQWLGDLARKSEASRTAAEAAIKEVEREIVNELGIADGKYATEVRAHLMPMAKNDRINAIRAAIEKRDTETLGAVFSAPAYLSGFTDDEQALFRRQYAEKHAAPLLARKAAIERSIDVNNRAFNSALVEVGTMFPKGKIADITSRIEKANAAKDNILNG
jgi:hypothetical protein